jgi:hypothetical protein
LTPALWQPVEAGAAIRRSTGEWLTNSLTWTVAAF